MIDLILDNCLEEIRAHRATVASCLERYSDHRAELEPLLKLALELEDAPDVKPSSAFKLKTRSHLLRLPTPPEPRFGRRLRNWLVPRRAS